MNGTRMSFAVAVFLASIAGNVGKAQLVPADVAPPVAVAPWAWRMGFWPEGGFVEAGATARVLQADSVGSAWWGWAEASAVGGWTESRGGMARKVVLRPGLTAAVGVGVRRRRWSGVGVVDYGPVASVGLSGKVGPADGLVWCAVDGVEQFTWGVTGTRTVGALVGSVAWRSGHRVFVSCAGQVHPRVWLGGWMAAAPWRLGCTVAWAPGARPVWMVSGPHPLFGWTWGVGK